MQCITNTATMEHHFAAPGQLSIQTRMLTVNPLSREGEEEVLAFLARRSVSNVIMSGFIRDNGAVSPFNRGTFYVCRDRMGQLEGIALVGHSTLVEARTEAALAALARHAREDGASIQTMLGEQNLIKCFWDHYATPAVAGATSQTPRRICSELVLEQRFPIGVLKGVPGLRLATLDDLPEIISANAEIAFADTGVNPLEKDPVGFHKRMSRRIDGGRMWVFSEEGRLIFKADVVADTPEAVYLEGIYVNPHERGKGWGTRCLSQLTRHLLAQRVSAYLLVNEENTAAQRLYHKAGYKQCSRYHLILV
ncbi:MAG: GNAT family N-acetyltransferase [Pyrinomonadaceae bacterium]|nr:GNAT family N-acetyltransferase [Pyrinomonadaceae bacterium]